MKIEIIDNLKDFLSLESIWNEVLEKSQSDHVCLTFEWFKSWWPAFGKNKQLFILLFKDEGNFTIGIAPFMLCRSRCAGLPVKKISFIYNDNSSRADFLLTGARDNILKVMVDYLNVNKDKWNIIELQNMPNESSNFEILQKALRSKGMLFGIKEGLHSPFIPIKSDWQAYFCSRSKKFRKYLRNIINRLTKSGNYIIERIDSRNINQETLNRIFEISNKSWKAKCKKEITHNEENRRFFEEFSQITNEKGWLNVWILNINGKDAAYEYLLRYREKIYALKADFNEKYKYASPGSITNMSALEYYFNNNLKEFDFCGHDEEYKKKWAVNLRQHSNFIIYEKNFYGWALYLLDYKFIYHIKVFLKKFKIICKLNISLKRRRLAWD